ncbi:erythromycin esterase family protein [Psychrobacillus sp. FSL K6-4046]|uniref:erythromycin esterase family protein n=1 Tax=Psychrobacillus sp. FSL K6-4046 TaxID=2921550 RepID=UPI00315AAF37
MERNFIVVMVILLAVLLTGCSSKAADNAESFISTVEAINIPDGVKVIGLGEATHGNVEFQELKKDVFESLIKQENVRVFVIEGDFGGGQQINDFILNGTGTAEEAVNTLDYAIYKTEQMVNLVQWMHDYNAIANEEEKLYFYGNDMQRYDYSKKGVLDFYQTVNENAFKNYESKLEHVSNENMRELTTDQLNDINQTVEEIIQDLQSNEAAYIEKTNKEAHSLALQYAQIMRQRTQLFLNEKDYMQLRDEYLAQNLQWIMEFETARGNEKVFFNGHNGHVEKTSASLAGYKSMGHYLDEQYGEAYFAIGTDFTKSKFQSKNGSGERKDYKVKNNNDLTDAFSKVESNIFYVDFEKAGESEVLKDIISKKQKMANIGDDFRYWYKFLKMFYTIEMVPNEAYDGVIIVKEATPTSVNE